MSACGEGIQEPSENEVKVELRPRISPRLWSFPTLGGGDSSWKGRMSVLTGRRVESGGRGAAVIEKVLAECREGEVRGEEERGRGDICNI